MNENENKTNAPAAEPTEKELGELRKVRREKLATLQADGKDPFQITKYDVSHRSGEIKAKFDELENQNVSIAGRLMSKRVMGKASFAHVLDFDGQIQVYASRDAMGEENYAAFKKLDIGDIVGVKVPSGMAKKHLP